LTQFCLGCEKLGGRSTSTLVSEVAEKGVPLLRSFLRVLRNKSKLILQNFLGVVRLLYSRISWMLRRKLSLYTVFPGCKEILDSFLYR
jgi:hypothetical protein